LNNADMLLRLRKTTCPAIRVRPQCRRMETKLARYLQALSRAAEISMQAFTEKPPVALPRDMEDQDWVGEGSDSQVLDVDATWAARSYLRPSRCLVAPQNRMDQIISYKSKKALQRVRHDFLCSSQMMV